MVTDDRADAHAAGLLDAGHPGTSGVVPRRSRSVDAVRRRRRDAGGAAVARAGLQTGRRQRRRTNTGGMGAYAPLPWLPDELTEQIVSEIIKPVGGRWSTAVARSAASYAACEMTSAGPAVVEFDCRFGDRSAGRTTPLYWTPTRTAASRRGNGQTCRTACTAVASPGATVAVRCWRLENYPAGRGSAT